MEIKRIGRIKIVLADMWERRHHNRFTQRLHVHGAGFKQQSGNRLLDQRRWKTSFVLVTVQGSADLCQAKGRYGDPLRGGKQGVDEAIDNIGPRFFVKPLDPRTGVAD